jgi:hypothetical protein
MVGRRTVGRPVRSHLPSPIRVHPCSSVVEPDSDLCATASLREQFRVLDRRIQKQTGTKASFRAKTLRRGGFRGEDRVSECFRNWNAHNRNRSKPTEVLALRRMVRLEVGRVLRRGLSELFLRSC